MNDEIPHDHGQGRGEPHPGDDPTTQQVQHMPVSARVPDKVGQGVFSTGAIVLQAGSEFVLDFVQRLAPPPRLVARVVLPTSFVPNLIAAFRDNLNRYQATFGTPPAIQPPPPGATPVPLPEVYEQLKLPDDLLSGSYANAARVSHSQAEFCLDFITNFFPRSAVSCRVYLAAAHVPALVNTLHQALQQYHRKVEGGQQSPPGSAGPPTS
jgi:hypothetical protein